jgi:hypothetical protein
MTVRITVKNTAAGGATMRMDLEPYERISEIVQCAAEFWNKDAGTYVVKKGKTMLRENATVQEENLMDDDVVELIPDPEGGASWAFRDPSS